MRLVTLPVGVSLAGHVNLLVAIVSDRRLQGLYPVPEVGLQAGGGHRARPPPYDAPMRAPIVGLLAISLAGCAGTVPFADGPPVPPGPLGPIIPSQGGGPPIECRAVPREQCASFGQSSGDPDVVRYIVTCTSVCTPEKGDVRIDIVGADGSTRAAGSGSYSSAPAEPAPALTPEPSDPGPS